MIVRNLKNPKNPKKNGDFLRSSTSHGLLAILGCVSAAVESQSWIALISFLSGQAVMISVVTLYSAVAAMLIRDSVIQVEELGIAPRDLPSDDVEENGKGSDGEEEDPNNIGAEWSGKRDSVTKAVTIALLLPLKIIVLLVPFLLYRVAGRVSLIWFVLGLLGEVFLLLWTSPPHRQAGLELSPEGRGSDKVVK